MSAGASSASSTPHHAFNAYDEEQVPTRTKLPPLVEKALKELPTADPLVAPLTRRYTGDHNWQRKND